MHVRDEEQWNQQLTEFNADEDSQKFRDFLVFWVDAAEKMVEDEPQLTVRDSLLQAFEVAEQTFGYLSTEWLGQMLLVIVQHWFNGDTVWECMSPWERRMVEQATAMKIVELQQLAEVDDTAGAAETG